ncbi:unnamed protein product [Pleuronectes platessa]|uniref:Uncharacterized protein n=1 Tax=Pleuronectes platessa TaxID=8262 RepID=A0A9N7UQ47_PLEPL|nr:unnamed protein product [Pleuronectes platessa]
MRRSDRSKGRRGRRKGTNKNLARSRQPVVFLKCAPARHTAALVSRLEMSCRSPPLVSSLTLPPSLPPLSADLSGSGELHGEKDKDTDQTALSFFRWFETLAQAATGSASGET